MTVCFSEHWRHTRITKQQRLLLVQIIQQQLLLRPLQAKQQLIVLVLLLQQQQLLLLWLLRPSLICFSVHWHPNNTIKNKVLQRNSIKVL